MNPAQISNLQEITELRGGGRDVRLLVPDKSAQRCRETKVSEEEEEEEEGSSQGWD